MSRRLKRSLYIVIAAILTVVMVISTVMTAFAWSDFTQSKVNNFRGTVAKTTVTLHKYETDAHGAITSKPVANAEFLLIKINGDGSETQIGTVYKTNTSGKITVEKLNSGSYYFLETNPGYGYTYEQDSSGNNVTKYHFTITADDTQSAAIVAVDAYNVRQTSALEVSKTVVNPGGTLTNGQKNQQFEFTVSFSDGKYYQYKIVPGDGSLKTLDDGKFYLRHGEKAVFESVPVGVYYNIAETENPSYFTLAQGSSGNILLDETSKASFTNTFTDSDKGSLIVSKTVSGVGSDTNKAFEFRITFSVPGSYTYKLNGTGADIAFTSGGTLTLKHNETAVFDNLPAGMTYTVTETKANQDGYAACVSDMSGKIIPGEVTAAFENHKGDEKNGALEIRKTVTGTTDTSKEFEFTVTFTGDNAVDVPFSYITNKGRSGTITNTGVIKLKGGETALFSAIPAGVTYKVVEKNYAPDGYTQSLTEQNGTVVGGGKAVAAYNNHKEPNSKQTKVTVEKLVKGEIPDSEKEREFGFTFIKNDEEPVHFSLKAGEKKTFILDVGDIYTVTEDDPFKYGYIQTSAVNGSGTATENEIKLTITNTYIGTVWKTISGTKTWDLKGQPDSIKPQSITVQLLANGNVVQTATVTPDESGNWNYSFLAPKYDGNNKEINYTIKEVPVPGFVSEVTGNNIKNIAAEPVVHSPASVKKIVNGNKPTAADTFTFKLTAKNAAPMPAGSDTEKTIIISGEGEANFGDIRYENAGTFVYTISEVKGDAKCTYDESAYTVTVTVAQSGERLAVTSVIYTKTGSDTTFNKATFVNSYGNPDETSVSVQKKWSGENNSLQPKEIKVQLYKNGAAFGEMVALNKENEWKYTWIGLDKNSTWTVDEPDVPAGYVKTVSGDAKTGFVITNTFSKPNDDEVLVSGFKTWDHGANPISARPENITVHIKNGDKIVATAIVGEQDHWQWTFKLPKYEADGNTQINYTVDENAVSDYTKYIDGYNLINTHSSSSSDKITLDGTKTWNYGNAPSNDRPEIITLYIKNGSKIAAEFEVTAVDNWRWSVQMPRYDESGNEIKYTVEEGNVPHYTHTVKGTNITNTYKGSSYPGDRPKTDDLSNLILWTVIFVTSAVLLAVIIIIGRRKQYIGKYYV